MFHNGMYICENTLTTIAPGNNGKYILTVYHKKHIILEKEYKTFTAARIQATRTVNMYDSIVAKLTNNFTC